MQEPRRTSYRRVVVVSLGISLCIFLVALVFQENRWTGKGATMFSARKDRQQQLSGEKTIPPSPVQGVIEVDDLQSCSCFNRKAGGECCRRTVRQIHKMGYVLIRQLFGDIRGVYVTQKPRKNNTVDYRDVVFTRNWYDSLVSGYLYHKTGHECWLSPMGREKKAKDMKGKLLNVPHWDSIYMTWGEANPPADGRSVCKYLEEESETDGMRVYIDVAFGLWYNRGIVHGASFSKGKEGNDRTLFLCYEDLTDPAVNKATAVRAHDWMFPGESHWKTPEISTDGAGHATSHNEELRSRLRDIIQTLDSALFNNTIARLDEEFPCGPRYGDRISSNEGSG